jgi:hypothetical protein
VEALQLLEPPVVLEDQVVVVVAVRLAAQAERIQADRGDQERLIVVELEAAEAAPPPVLGPPDLMAVQLAAVGGIATLVIVVEARVIQTDQVVLQTEVMVQVDY